MHNGSRTPDQEGNFSRHTNDPDRPMGDLACLREPFPAADLEWRVQQCGTKNGRVWARVVAYVTARAIQDRLDAVCGPENWKNVFRAGPAGGVLCGLAIRIGGEWVTKWNGAENTDIESVKGGLSAATKRAAVEWGIGRYLYGIEEGWANVHESGRFRGRTKEGVVFRWDPPELPASALPGNGTRSQRTIHTARNGARKASELNGRLRRANNFERGPAEGDTPQSELGARHPM